MSEKRTTKRYRVWIEQINAQLVEVTARGPEDAKRRAAALYRREFACPEITQVREIPKGSTDAN